jgi:phosphoribosylglycinamide formyltransferase-1
MRNLVVLASGSGSLLQALIDSPARGEIYEISCVISDNPTAAALDRATRAGIVAIALPHQREDQAAWQQALLVQVLDYQPDLVVSAGFMRIIKSALFELVPTINAHPSLLPEFPGAHAVADALAAKVQVTGATVHYIDQGIDSGKVISQRKVPVLAQDSVSSLHERIKQVEREQLVEVVVKLCQQSDLRAGIQL